MRIGIDARFLTHPQAGGFKTYTTNLIHSLGQIDHENEYIVYIDREPAQNTLPAFANFRFRVVPLYFPYLGMVFREQLELPGQIRKDNLDLIHFPCNTAPINLKQKYVLTLHDTIQLSTNGLFSTGFNPHRIKDQVINKYSKWTILKTANKAERIITVSQFEKESISNHLGIKKERIDVTYLGVNPVFKPANPATKEIWRKQLKRELNLPSRFIMGVGYEPRKNIPLLIQAFALLAPSHPDLSLVLVVAHNQARENYQQLAHKLKISDRIVILGSQSSFSLARLYNLAEVFVFPSERESFGLPPLEALACGTPTMAMNKTSLPEILGNGALLIDSINQVDWAEVIDRVLTNSDIREDLINRGLKQAAKRTWQRCLQETILVYQSAVLGFKSQVSFIHQ